jgi:hypothetical protein
MAIYLIDLFLLISIFCVYASHPALDDLHANKQYPNVIPAINPKQFSVSNLRYIGSRPLKSL